MKWHPFAERFPALTGDEWTAFKASIEETKGNTVPIIYRIANGEKQGIDGRNRERACDELGLQIAAEESEIDDADVKAFIIVRNIHRRHMTKEIRHSIVAELRADGKSIRAIAETVGVPKSTVERDLSGVPNGTPGPKNIEEMPISEPETAKVTGKDGKEYQAKKPPKAKLLCERCTRKGEIKPCEMCAELRKKAKAPKQPIPVEDTPEPPDEPKDENGELWREKAPRALKAIEASPVLKEMSRQLAGMIAKIKDDETLALYTYSKQSVMASMKTLKETLLGAIPSYVCPYCNGTTKTIEGMQKGKGCEVCERQGWVTSYAYRRSPKGTK